jgi:hypothetical protein
MLNFGTCTIYSQIKGTLGSKVIFVMRVESVVRVWHIGIVYVLAWVHFIRSFLTFTNYYIILRRQSLKWNHQINQ